MAERRKPGRQPGVEYNEPQHYVTQEVLGAINRAREAIGLPLLTVKMRKCLACGKRFKSIERRTCGCNRNKDEEVTYG